MIYRVKIQLQAKQDIKRNASWWAKHHSTQQAKRWTNAVREQIRTLENQPLRCPLSVENSKFSFEIRDHLVGTGPHPTHRAIFTIQGETVYVLTVRRAAEDQLQPRDLVFPKE